MRLEFLSNCKMFFQRWIHYSGNNKNRSVLTVLLVMIVLSAFAIVYSQDVYRRLLIEKQYEEVEQHALQVERGKLLLERGVLTSEARIESLARRLLDMEMPDGMNTSLIKVK